ncbi:MAG TPA: hypothetical protein VKD08_03340 [Ignavibacteriaceae bacterium]|nr:hypothetical protein [Ignavibacteriaceae bacterium]
MKVYFLLVAAVLMITFTACESKNEEANENLPAGTHKIVVSDILQTPNYTYIKASENGNEYWIAVTKMLAEKGETLYFSKSMEMKNFKSDALNRTFESVLFVQDISQTPPSAQKPVNHPQVYSQSKEDVNITPLKDGKTIAQIYDKKDDLNGQTVRVKGKVVKYNPHIMGRNWIHIQDGTSSGNNFDLMVTSPDSAKAGDVVIVEGTVEINQDFGAGYAYPVMLSNATVKEQ